MIVVVVVHTVNILHIYCVNADFAVSERIRFHVDPYPQFGRKHAG